MNLEQLSRKQKRIKDWTQFLQSEVPDDSIRLALSDELKTFRNLLAKCWENEQFEKEDLNTLTALERKIEQLMEEARLFSR